MSALAMGSEDTNTATFYSRLGGNVKLKIFVDAFNKDFTLHITFSNPIKG